MSRFADLIPQGPKPAPDPNRTAMVVGEEAEGKGLALMIAKALDMAGAGAPTNYGQTGWWRGPDGEWRREIDDSGASLQNGELVHPELEKAMPGFLDAHPLRITNSLPPGVAGAYDYDKDEVAVAEEMPSSEEAMRTVLHEYQHAIQNAEGFEQGTYPGDAKLLSEVMKQKKGNMTLEQKLRDPFLAMPTEDELFEGYFDTQGEMEAYDVEDRWADPSLKAKRPFPWTHPTTYDQPLVLSAPNVGMKYDDTGLAALVMRMLGKTPNRAEDFKP
jgi:hypothetical protein